MSNPAQVYTRAARYTYPRCTVPRSAPARWSRRSNGRAGSAGRCRSSRRIWGPHAHRRLVEPFAGGLAIALGLMPEARSPQRRQPAPHQFLSLAQARPHRRLEMLTERADAVLPAPAAVQRRSCGRASHRTREAAGLFYFLNRTGYNGLCRFNSQRRVQRPVRTASDDRRPTAISRVTVEAFADWQFSNLHFTIWRWLDRTTSSTPIHRTTWSSRTIRATAFRWDDQVATAERLASMTVRCSWPTRRPSGSGEYERLGFESELDAHAGSAALATASQQWKSSRCGISRMSPGSTRTGGVLERMILPRARSGRIFVRNAGQPGQRLGARKHVVDAVAHEDGRNILISLKWQQVSGTAEQKVPFELICLLEALRSRHHDKAYLVLGRRLDARVSIRPADEALLVNSEKLTSSRSKDSSVEPTRESSDPRLLAREESCHVRAVVIGAGGSEARNRRP